MKTLKAVDTIIITGIFRKRYWQIMPGVSVYELPKVDLKEQQLNAKAIQDAKKTA